MVASQCSEGGKGRRLDPSKNRRAQTMYMKPTANHNLFTTDCNTCFYRYGVQPDWQKTGLDGRFSAKSTHAYVDLVAANGVDTFVYNPNASRAWWPSKHTPTAWDGYRRGDQSFFKADLDLDSLTPEQLEDAMSSRTTLEVDEYLPLRMEPNMQRRFRLPMCAEPAELRLTVQLVLERPEGESELPPIGLSFNESWPTFDGATTDALLEPAGPLTHHVFEHTAINFAFPASAVREGWNDLVVVHGGLADNLAHRRQLGATIVGIELLVEPTVTLDKQRA